MEKDFICINCPMGCHLHVTYMLDENKKIDETSVVVEGYTCGRGKKYGAEELVHPSRMVTSSVKVSGGVEAVVSVKTRNAIPKELIFDSLEELKKVELKAPVKIGDIVIPNLLNTGIDVIATRNIGVK